MNKNISQGKQLKYLKLLNKIEKVSKENIDMMNKLLEQSGKKLSANSKPIRKMKRLQMEITKTTNKLRLMKGK